MEEKKTDIASLIPTNSSFKLKQFDDFEFQLKPCTGGQLAEMNNRIGNVEALMATPTSENISKIALSLMDYESSLKFKKQTVKFIDTMTGEETEEDIGGYKLLMRAIGGINEQYQIYKAILESIGYSKEEAKRISDQLRDGISGEINKAADERLKKKMSESNQ